MTPDDPSNPKSHKTLRKIWKKLRADVRRRPEAMKLPQHILERVERLHSYHQRSKVIASGARPAPPEDPALRPAGFRVFTECPKVALPTSLLDAPGGAITLLSAGQDALPDSFRAPPQDLKTLASWLYYAAGETARMAGTRRVYSRALPDPEAMSAVEIYVAAFAIEGLDPGLYHFCPREFALRQLRKGSGALLQIRKGRPDLEFLKILPAALLVSGCYARSVWRWGRRGYRALLTDVGQMVQNLTLAGAGVGVQTMARLRLNDLTMRDLIGLAPEEPPATAEAVHAMVAWADPATKPIELPPGAGAPAMTPIARARLSEALPMSDEVGTELLYVHQDCAAPGVAVQQIRPPLTELCPLPATHVAAPISVDKEPSGGLPVRQVLMDRKPAPQLLKRAIARPDLLALNRVAMRGGSYFPMFPEGPHLAMVRPFWIVQDVSGIERGLWYYHPPKDAWHLLSTGQYRREAKYIAGDRDTFGDAPAVCVLTANLHTLMTQGGPDTYRLAHLEAGIAGQRIYLAASSLGLACNVAPDFYDEDARAFFGLNKTGWEALGVIGVGYRA
ncbi:MAG: nitroreductase family protein [Phycisphaerae bacterium]